MTDRSPRGDPRGALFDRTDLIYGSQIGAWQEDGGDISDQSSPGFASARAMAIRDIRWQMWRTPAELRPGGQSTKDFSTGIGTIRALGALPLIGLPPVWDQQFPGGSDPWSFEWQQWVVRTACAGGAVLFEVGNEPDNYGHLSPDRYFDTLWTGAPRLKRHARALGYEIFIGGPAWSNWYAWNVGEVEQWLGRCKDAYVSSGYDRDWLPDFVSAHTYLTDQESQSFTNIQSAVDGWGARYDDLRMWINDTFTGCTDRGYPVARQIKLADTEWGDWYDGYTGSREFCEYFVGAMFAMMRAPAPDGSQRVWLASQFTLNSHDGGPLDMLHNDGSYKPLGLAFKAHATSAPTPRRSAGPSSGMAAV